MRLGIILSILIISPLHFSCSAKPGQVVVVSTSQTTGHVSRSIHHKSPMGGMARRASVIRRIREQGLPTLLVDGGNFAPSRVSKFYSGPSDPVERAEFVWDLMSNLGYDVVTPGDQELMLGLDSVVNLYSRHPEITVVSANVTNKEGFPIFPPLTIMERGGVRFGITGVTDPQYYDFNLRRGLQKHDDFAFTDPHKALREALSTLKAESEVIVVLLHGFVPHRELPEFMKGLEEVNVLVMGHNPGHANALEFAGASVVIRAGARGNYVGIAQFSPGDAAESIGEILALDESVFKDAYIDSVVAAFESFLE